ncbi:MAG TPA: TIGR02996 domain-containing protein [Gemmata sp.]
MNEEAALWAALVANPGDATLRFVYADWLQEQDDPRTPWFRDEQLWVAAQPFALQPLLSGIGPGPLHPVERLLIAVSEGSPLWNGFIFHHLVRPFGSPFIARLRAWGAEAPIPRGRSVYGQLARLQEYAPPKLEPVPKLIRRLTGRGWYAQWLAVIDLGHHGPAAADAVPKLIKLRLPDAWEADELYFDSSRDRPHPFSTAIYHTLGCIGPAAQDAVPMLASAGWYDHSAYAALAKIQPDPLVVLAHITDDDDGDTRVGLGVVQELDPTGTGALAHAVRHETGRKRYLAAERLGQMGRHAAHVLPVLTEVLESLGDIWDRELAEMHIREAVEQISHAN